MVHRVFSAHRFFGLFLAAGFLGLVVSPGCGKKKGEKKEAPPAVKINWGAKWTRINSDGEKGKFWIKQGFGHLQGATTGEERKIAFEEMVKGHNLIMDAVQRGEDLVETVEMKEPGRTFPQWQKSLAKWTEEASKVRKSGIPLEYVDEMNK